MIASGAKRPFDKVPTSANPKSAKAKRAMRFPSRAFDGRCIAGYQSSS